MVVTVDNKPDFPVTDPSSGTAGDDVAARRRMLFERFENSESGENRLDLTAETSKPAVPVEKFESLTLQTPIGEIEFGPPSGISLTMRIATMMGESNPNRVTNAMLRTLMSVRSVNGRKVSPVTSMIEAQFLANELGDNILDFLFGTMAEYWPPPGPAELQVIRKSKRVS